MADGTDSGPQLKADAAAPPVDRARAAVAGPAGPAAPTTGSPPASAVRPAARVILLLGLVLGLSAADSSSIGAIAPQLQPALGIGTAELGLLVTASSLVGALAAIPFGILVDKTRRVDVLAVSILLWGVAEVLSAFSPSFTMLLLTRLLLGAVTATAVPAVASLTGDFFPAGERGRIYGYIVTGEVVGAGLGVGISSLVSAAFGWRAAFLVLAVPSVALAWALWKRLPEPARGGQSRLEPGATTHPLGQGRGAAGAAAQRRRGGARPTTRCCSACGSAASATTSSAWWWRTRRRCRCGRWWCTSCACAPTSTIILASSLGYLFLAGLRTFAVLFVRGHFDVGQATATLMIGLVGARVARSAC